jgi:hypothetical protein
MPIENEPTDLQLEKVLSELSPSYSVISLQHFLFGVAVSSISISPRYLLGDLYDSTFKRSERHREQFIFLGEELWSSIHRHLSDGVAPLFRPQLKSLTEDSGQAGNLQELLQSTSSDLSHFLNGLNLRPDLDSLNDQSVNEILYEIWGAQDLLGHLASSRAKHARDGGELGIQAKAALKSHATYWRTWIPELHSKLKAKKFVAVK